MPDEPRPPAKLPESKVKGREKTRLSLVWIIPIAAAAVGAWVAITTIRDSGPKITIALDSAEGLEAGKTKLRYNGVDVGTITSIRLSDDHRGVVAAAQMAPKTEAFLVTDTKIWVVRPRISGANVSGLGTLISGAYLGLEIGRSALRQRAFTALAVPPVVGENVPGRFFRLKTPDLGSLDTGTPIFFRRLQVGEVAAYDLDPDGRSLTLKVFLRAPYDKYVSDGTRFWHASGVDVSFSASGLDVRTESLLSILIGGIAFETPPSDPPAVEAAADAAFTLFKDREAAFEASPRDPQVFLLVLRQSVHGLAVGAPVEFRGIPIGEVASIESQIDLAAGDFTVHVMLHVDAAKFGVKFVNPEAHERTEENRRRFVDLMVAKGMRAQLESGNLLTGALLVNVDFFPDAPAAAIDWTQQPAELPTVPGQFEALEASVTSIVRKLDALPIAAIGEDARKAIADLDQAILGARSTVDHVDDLIVNKLGKLPYDSIGDDLTKAISELSATLVSARRAVDSVHALVQPDSELASEVTITLQGVARAARDLGLLLDYLERHPEALIRGKAGEGE